MPQDPSLNTEVEEKEIEAPATEPQTEEKPAEEVAAGAEKAAEPEYVPNYKLKIRDEEKEIEEWARPYINKDTEAKFRELYEKYYGFDHVKSKREEFEKKALENERKVQEYVQTVQSVRGLADKDFGRFLKEVNIQPKTVVEWINREIEKQELLQREDIPDWAKKIYTDNEERDRQLEELKNANQSLSTREVDMAVSQRQSELQSVLNSPDVKSFVDQFDSRLARPGAFVDMVIRHGKHEFEASKGQRDLTAQEAVNEVLRILNHQPQVQAGNPGAESSTKNGSPANSPKVITQAKPTVIPNVGAGATTPTARRPRSVDALRKLAKEMASGDFE